MPDPNSTLGALARPTNPPVNKTNSTSGKRVAIVTDTTMHLGPFVARDLARLNHNLVIGMPADGLADELRGLGAEVAVVTGIEDLTKPDAVQKLVDAANKTFGGFDAACIRAGRHLTGDIIQATPDDMQAAFEGNTMSDFYALQALLPPLMESGYGQVLIVTSASGERHVASAMAYSTTRAAANMMVKCAATTAAPRGVCVNALGTMSMNYPGFVDSTGADDPETLKAITELIPLGRLGEPSEAAHFAVSLLDGRNMYQTGNFFPVSGGYNNA